MATSLRSFESDYTLLAPSITYLCHSLLVTQHLQVERHSSQRKCQFSSRQLFQHSYYSRLTEVVLCFQTRTMLTTYDRCKERQIDTEHSTYKGKKSALELAYNETLLVV